MNTRMKVNKAGLAAVVAVGALAGAAAPAAAGQDGSWSAPRTPWGDPDLQGKWGTDGHAPTPMERPAGFGGRELLTQEEIAEREVAEAAEFDRLWSPEQLSGPRSTAEIERGAEFEDGIVGQEYNNFWMPRPDAARKIWPRTSLVVDPPDGRIPPLTLPAVERLEARHAARLPRGIADSWVDRNLHERCIRPVMSSLGATKQIVQAPGYVAMLLESIGLWETRVVPLDGRPPIDSDVTTWTGAARGRWEGDTLVVETANFNGRQDGGPIMPTRRVMGFYPGSGATLKLVERFTRVADDTIEHAYTVEDPMVYSRPYTVLRPLSKLPDDYLMLEVACHEGNYGMTNLLEAGRANEQLALDEALGEAETRGPEIEALRRRAEGR